MDKTPERMRKTVKRGYRYPEGRFEIGKIEGKQIKFYEGMISRKKLMSKSYLWNKGKYIVYAKIKNDKGDENRDITIAIYSEVAAKIRESSDKEIKRYNGEIVEDLEEE